MFCRKVWFYFLICFTILQENLVVSPVAKKKGLIVEKDIKYPPYDKDEFEIFEDIVEIIGSTIEDQSGLWLTYHDTCDPDVHKDKLSNKYDLSNFYDEAFIGDLCSIFEDLACDTVEKVCKCWTLGGVGRMEWQPEYQEYRTDFENMNTYGNPNKPQGRCVMTARQRCGDVNIPAGLYPSVDFPVFRKLDCDYINGYKCLPDLDGISRCYYGPQVNRNNKSSSTYQFCSVHTYILSMILNYFVLSYN